MTVHVTFHSLNDADQGNGRAVVRGPRVSDSQALTVGASAQNGTASPTTGQGKLIARIVTTTTPCRIQVGAEAVATSASAYFPAGFVDEIVVKAGDRVSVIQV